MISFANDYAAGAHPKILERLVETNMESLPGYGTDRYCQSAAEKIKQACACPDADVFFISGGTQTNQTVIGTMLKGFEGVISAVTGHVNAHEAGAIEYSGHKVIALPAMEGGKLNAADVRSYLEGYYADPSYEHMVFPGMVYISWPTEYGGLYTKKELEDLHSVCRDYEIPLFVDGARLGYGLCCEAADISLEDLASLCDVFYIGGTKVGALCGEAVVFTHHNAPERFITMTKQRGAMLAKGRLLGVQFDTLFTDGLYFELGKHAAEMTRMLRAVLEKKYPYFYDSPTNQQFVILENSEIERLTGKVVFSIWEKYDDTHTVVRFATNWATQEEDILELEKALEV